MYIYIYIYTHTHTYTNTHTHTYMQVMSLGDKQTTIYAADVDQRDFDAL